MLIQNIIIEKYIKHIKIKDEYIKIEIIVFSIFKYSPKIPDEPFNPSKFHFIHYPTCISPNRKLFISSNGFQKISTAIQNILIKSISHSVNFTIPDLKPHTRTHWIYTRPFWLESVISSIDSNRSNNGSGGTRPGNELRLKLVHTSEFVREI